MTLVVAAAASPPPPAGGGACDCDSGDERLPAPLASPAKKLVMSNLVSPTSHLGIQLEQSRYGFYLSSEL
jgi:hypothetical protein